VVKRVLDGKIQRRAVDAGLPTGYDFYLAHLHVHSEGA
jgi:hypothetical protein